MVGRGFEQLRKFKEWFTVAEAARQLSIPMEDEIGEAGVLRLALDGHLKLSFFFSNPTAAIFGTIVTVDDISDHFPCDSHPFEEEIHDGYHHEHDASARYMNNYFEWVSCTNTLLIDGGRKQVLEVKSHSVLEDVWDLTMRGGERGYIEHLHRRLANSARATRNHLKRGVQNLGEIPVVKGVEEQGSMGYALLPEPPFIDFIPKGSRLVVREAALQELEGCISSVDPHRQTGIAAPTKDDAERRKRIEAVLAYARTKQFPKGTSQTKMAEHITKQYKNQGFSPSALRQILGGRYKPMRRLGLDGLD